MEGSGGRGEGNAGKMLRWDNGSSQKRPGLCRLLHYLQGIRTASRSRASTRGESCSKVAALGLKLFVMVHEGGLAIMGHVLGEGPSLGNLPALNTGEDTEACSSCLPTRNFEQCPAAAFTANQRHCSVGGSGGRALGS